MAKFVHRMVQLVFLPILLLIFLELGLRLLDYGASTSLFLLHDSSSGRLFAANYQVGYRFFPPHLARRPLPEIFSATKSPKTIRIFVLGESAARGESLSDFSFSRMLPLLLEASWPEYKFEVINTGIPAINSWVLCEFAREITSYQPDLIILYAGHNEVVGPYGPGTVFTPMAPRLIIQSSVWLSNLRMTQLARNVRNLLGFKKFDATPTNWKGLEMFQSHRIPPRDPRIIECAKNFQANVEEIIRISRRAGASVIVCNPPTNLADCPPFASLHTPGLASSVLDDWRRAFDKGIESLNAGNLNEAKKAFTIASELDTGYAETFYRLGRCALAMGCITEARKAFVQARDLDALYVRAGSPFQIALASACQNVGPDKNVIRVDLEPIFDQNSANHITGKDLIYDHVHLTVAGHALIAETLTNIIRQNPPANLASHQAASESLPTLFSREELLKQLGYTAWDELRHLENLLSAYRQPPFTAWIDHSYRLNELEKNIAKLKSKVAKDAADIVADLGALFERFPYRVDIALRLAQISAELGRFEEALVYYDRAVALNPFDIYAYNNRGLTYLALGQIASAISDFTTALKLAPNFPGGHFNLAIALTRSNRIKEAKAEYLEALRYDPGYLQAHLNLGNLLLQSGQTNEALNHYRAALDISSDSATVHLNLANALLQEGLLDDAIAEYACAIKLDHGLVAAHYGLGNTLLRAGRVLEAKQAFLAAIKEDPNHLPSLKQVLQIVITKENTNVYDLAPIVELGERAVHLSGGQDASLLQLLAAVYALSGRIEEAKNITEQALKIAMANGETALVKDLRENLAVLEQQIHSK